jgi:hypothetical protein
MTYVNYYITTEIITGDYYPKIVRKKKCSKVSLRKHVERHTTQNGKMSDEDTMKKIYPILYGWLEKGEYCLFTGIEDHTYAHLPLQYVPILIS